MKANSRRGRNGTKGKQRRGEEGREKARKRNEMKRDVWDDKSAAKNTFRLGCEMSPVCATWLREGWAGAGVRGGHVKGGTNRACGRYVVPMGPMGMRSLVASDLFLLLLFMLLFMTLVRQMDGWIVFYNCCDTHTHVYMCMCIANARRAKNQAQQLPQQEQQQQHHQQERQQRHEKRRERPCAPSSCKWETP